MWGQTQSEQLYRWQGAGLTQTITENRLSTGANQHCVTMMLLMEIKLLIQNMQQNVSHYHTENLVAKCAQRVKTNCNDTVYG